MELSQRLRNVKCMLAAVRPRAAKAVSPALTGSGLSYRCLGRTHAGLPDRSHMHRTPLQIKADNTTLLTIAARRRHVYRHSVAPVQSVWSTPQKNRDQWSTHTHTRNTPASHVCSYRVVVVAGHVCGPHAAQELVVHNTAASVRLGWTQNASRSPQYQSVKLSCDVM